MQDDPIFNNVKDFILRLENNPGTTKFAVSFSGGADSGVLLDVFVRLYRNHLISEPIAVYFNHNLRGKESEAEEKFIRSVCADYGIELVIIELDVTDYALLSGLTTETAARKLRYDNYALLLKKYDYIVQGHHEDDNAETVFFNIMRGAGLEGSSGIKKVRDGIIRPLLDFSRRDILKYSNTHKLKFFTDSTNEKTDFSRNRIRHIIFPVIEKELNRNIIRSLNNFSQASKEALDYISATAESIYKRCVRTSPGMSVIRFSRFKRLEPFMKKMILQRALRQTGTVYNPDRIKTEIIIDGIEKRKPSVFSTKDYSISIYSDNIIIIDIHLYNNPVSIILSSKRRSPYYIDMNKVKGNVRICDISGNDQFVPFGKKSPVAVSKVLSDKKIPTMLRKSLKCLRDDEKIIFIQGAGISDAVKAGKDPELIYIVLKNDILRKLF
ncbi:MAG TPA: tRNA lysidine(34) synthetase TilS [Clostridiales bacterium]|nr:tRNA lysidine(34) synthetase TilS [Clostridiales bacterium]